MIVLVLTYHNVHEHVKPSVLMLVLLALPLCLTALSFRSVGLIESQKAQTSQMCLHDARIARLLGHRNQVATATELPKDNTALIKDSLIELQCARSLFIPGPTKAVRFVRWEASKLPGKDIAWEEMGLVRSIHLRRSRKPPISLDSQRGLSWEQMGLARSLRLRSPRSEGTVLQLPLARQPARVLTPSFPEMSRAVSKVMSRPTPTKESGLVPLKAERSD